MNNPVFFAASVFILSVTVAATAHINDNGGWVYAVMLLLGVMFIYQKKSPSFTERLYEIGFPKP